MVRSRSLWGCLIAAVAATAGAHDVVLVTGDVLHGEVAQHTAEQLVLDHPVLGKLAIPADKIKRVTPAVTITPPPPPKPWTRQLEAGVSGTRGNSTTSNSRVAIVAVRKTARHELKLDAAHYFASSNRRTTKSKFTAGILNDWLKTDSPWLYFAGARVDQDEFQSWDRRISGHVGTGRKVLDGPSLKGKVRVGAGAAKEWGSNDDTIRPEAMLGGEIAWAVSERQKIAAATTLFPDLGDPGEFRALTTLEWATDIDRVQGLVLKLGLEHEYQTQTDPGVENGDLRFHSSLVLKF